MAATKTPTKTEIGKIKADELRKRLQRRGVKGTDDLKKPELVKKMVKALAAETRAASTKRPPTTKKTLSASKPTDGEVATMKVADLRRRLAARGVKGTADLKKADLVKKMVKALSGTGATSAGKVGAGKTGAKATAAKK
jgi:hypothetical protein